MKTPEVVVSGYSSMDRIIRVTSPLKSGYTSLVANRDNAVAHYGGCSVNIACGLGVLGHSAAPVIRVGEDEDGEGYRSYLLSRGASAEGVATVLGQRTPNCYLLEDNEGNHVTVFYPGAMEEQYMQDYDTTLFEGARLAVLTVASRADNLQFLKKCEETGTPLAFGMKADLDAFPPELLKEILDYSTIIFLNHSERATIQELFDLGSITELFESDSLEHLVVTDGRKGSHCYEKVNGRVVRTTVPIVENNDFVDSIGAGDAYMAGFLSGYLDGQSGPKCAQMGSTLASFVVEGPGATSGLPTKNEFDERMERATRKEVIQ